eukprot:TRINITY_DN1161_c1_g1_i2.p1 TRINITY_DN1161_c1_g1~~TRINITY_DN1161_c1_g1_i2.p1  ORF type:complete len:179 (-),score=45.21 TRINITY_DN1161_c1_g1_i2:25-561(-)
MATALDFSQKSLGFETTLRKRLNRSFYYLWRVKRLIKLTKDETLTQEVNVKNQIDLQLLQIQVKKNEDKYQVKRDKYKVKIDELEIKNKLLQERIREMMQFAQFRVVDVGAQIAVKTIWDPKISNSDEESLEEESVDLEVKYNAKFLEEDDDPLLEYNNRNVDPLSTGAEPDRKRRRK